MMIALIIKYGILSTNFDNMEIVTKILNTLGVPGTAGRVYRELLTSGETTPRILATRMSMTRPSVYDQMHILESFGLIGTRVLRNKTYVSPTPPEYLLHLLKEKREEIEREESDFARIAESLAHISRTDAPRIKFFEGREAVQLALHDILWTGKTDLLALWPYDEMLDLFGAGFLKSFNEKRIRQKISLKTIWPHTTKQTTHIWAGSDTGVERRYLKTSKPIGMGYTIYEDTVIFVSSKKECYGFIISSRDYATMMRFQFALLWENALRK